MVLDGTSLGATPLPNGACRFCVWAPLRQRVEVYLLSEPARVARLRRDSLGYHVGEVPDVSPGSLYLYRLDGGDDRPDPASRWQPDGPHGPSAVCDSAFPWGDAGWTGLPLSDFVLYELHVGTFTPEGTFDAVVPHLDALRELGVTAVEIMPVAQFPGGRNWGYDGTFPYAVQNTYGGPDGLKRLVNECHRRGLAAILDVVYNHLGPEGNYLWDFGPYFTDRYRTPWGAAVNFDGPDSDGVRRFFVENALRWQTEFHFDGLRLDAVHAIQDNSARHFLQELAEATRERAGRLGRCFHLIAESNENDPRLIRPTELGGHGLDGMWSDDFHHSLRTLLTGDRRGYYQDFGTVEHLARAYRDGFVYTGQYSPHRRRRLGAPTRGRPGRQFVVCTQNHDQVGNRMLGERPASLLSPEALRLAAAAVILSPYVPLLFMGEEYGEPAPFQYFVSHTDLALVEAVRGGRREEFADFGWQGQVPDPQDAETFLRSRLNPALREGGEHRALRGFYRELLRLRREVPALALLSNEHLHAAAAERDRALYVRRWDDNGDEVFLLLHFGDTSATLEAPVPPGRWELLLDSSAARWGGGGGALPASLESPGAARLAVGPHAAAAYRRAGTS